MSVKDGSTLWPGTQRVIYMYYARSIIRFSQHARVSVIFLKLLIFFPLYFCSCETWIAERCIVCLPISLAICLSLCPYVCWFCPSVSEGGNWVASISFSFFPFPSCYSMSFCICLAACISRCLFVHLSVWKSVCLVYMCPVTVYFVTLCVSSRLSV